MDETERKDRLLLVVEDDDGIRRAISLLLEDAGYDVVGAVHGADALRRLASDPLPDAILLDLMMPVLDGPGFLAERRKDPRLAALPVAVITAHGSRAVVDEAEVNGWLQKPFSAPSLLATVRRLVGA